MDRDLPARILPTGARTLGCPTIVGAAQAATLITDFLCRAGIRDSAGNPAAGRRLSRMLAAEGMAVMADVTTTCSKCGATFETKRGLAVHRTRTHAAGADAAYSTATARAIPCTFPGCAAHFQSRLGLRIHTTLMGHQAPADTLAKGDGPPSRRRVRQTQPVEDSQIMDMGDMGDMG